MKIELISGTFEAAEAKDLMTKIVHTKIKFLEHQIARQGSDHEEEIKMRERKIIRLQNELKESLVKIGHSNASVEITANVELKS